MDVWIRLVIFALGCAQGVAWVLVVQAVRAERADRQRIIDRIRKRK